MASYTRSSHGAELGYRWLKQNKHLRYMWIPHTDKVVVVQCNNTSRDQPMSTGLLAKLTRPEARTYTQKERLQPFVDLMQVSSPHEEASTSGRSPMELRGELLHKDPLNVEWVKKVNEAEAEHWTRSRGRRIDWSDQILGFDCGGQQWVLEVAFPTGGTVKEPGDKVCTLNLKMLAWCELSTGLI